MVRWRWVVPLFSAMLLAAACEGVGRIPVAVGSGGAGDRQEVAEPGPQEDQWSEADETARAQDLGPGRPCEPECDGVVCNVSDGCGGLCGCLADQVCTSTGGGVWKCTSVCAGVCAGIECGTVGECWCGECPSGFDCSADNVCECIPSCTSDDGTYFECGDDGCGGSCGNCPYGDCHDHWCGSCEPDCAGKECGGDGCGGSCGSCPEGLFCSPQGQCSPGCDPLGITFSSMVQKVVWEEVGKGGHPGEALDIDQDPDTCAPAGYCQGGLNNQISGLLEQIETFVDWDVEIMKTIEDGTRVTLAELVGFQQNGGAFTINVYRGVPAVSKGQCDFQEEHCGYLVESGSIDPLTCAPMASFDNATVVNGKLSAGGPEYTFPSSVGFVAGIDGTFPESPAPTVQARSAMITATLALSSDGDLSVANGILGYAVVKAEMMAAVDLLDDSEMPVSNEMLKNLLDMFLMPDVDTDGDGVPDGCSLCVKFGTISGSIQGFAAE